MNKLDFAMGLIRAPWAKRLQDRTFLGMITTAAGAVSAAVAVWRTEGVPVDQKVNLTAVAVAAVAGVVAAWSHGNQNKDTEIAKAALTGGTPDTLAIGTVSASPVSASPAPTSLPVSPLADTAIFALDDEGHDSTPGTVLESLPDRLANHGRDELKGLIREALREVAREERREERADA